MQATSCNIEFQIYASFFPTGPARTHKNPSTFMRRLVRVIMRLANYSAALHFHPDKCTSFEAH